MVGSPKWYSTVLPGSRALRQLFGVSVSELLRRATEIAGVVAVFARIGSGLRTNRSSCYVSCNATNNPPVYLSEPLEQLIARKMNDGHCPRFSVEAAAGDQLVEIPCELRKFATGMSNSGLVYGLDNPMRIAADLGDDHRRAEVGTVERGII
jgi:hypothetical protein